MASAIEYNRLRNVHVDSANPGVNVPAQSHEIAQCNSQTHGEEAMAATPAVAPINTAVATAFLGPTEFDYNDRQKSACQKYYIAASQASCNVLMKTLSGNALMLVQHSNGDAVKALTLLNKQHCELSSAHYQSKYDHMMVFRLGSFTNPRNSLETCSALLQTVEERCRASYHNGDNVPSSVCRHLAARHIPRSHPQSSKDD